MHKTITLTTGEEVKLWSDNEDCTVSVFNKDEVFDAESTYIRLYHYAEVVAKDRKELAFYQPYNEK